MRRLPTLQGIGQALGLLLLLLTQQGAVVHEIGHQVRAGTEIAAAQGAAQVEAGCALCPAYAQVITPAFTHAFQIPALERCAPERSTAPRFAEIDASVLSPRSRGPPAFS
jgi:hypothetical protein